MTSACTPLGTRLREIAPPGGCQRECAIGFYVWDRHLFLRRIPPPSHTQRYGPPSDPGGNYQYAVHLIVKDDHVEAWRTRQQIPANLRRAFSFFSAAIQALKPRMRN